MAPGPHLPRRRIYSRGWFILASAAALCLALAAALAAALCYAYWGYILAPPGVHPLVLRSTRLVAHSILGFSPDRPAELVDNWTVGYWNDPQHALDLTRFESIRAGDGAWRLTPPRLNARAWYADWVRRGVISFDQPPPPISPERARALPGL